MDALNTVAISAKLLAAILQGLGKDGRGLLYKKKTIPIKGSNWNFFFEEAILTLVDH